MDTNCAWKTRAWQRSGNNLEHVLPIWTISAWSGFLSSPFNSPALLPSPPFILPWFLVTSPTKSGCTNKSLIMISPSNPALQSLTAKQNMINGTKRFWRVGGQVQWCVLRTGCGQRLVSTNCVWTRSGLPKAWPCCAGVCRRGWGETNAHQWTTAGYACCIAPSIPGHLFQSPSTMHHPPALSLGSCAR